MVRSSGGFSPGSYSSSKLSAGVPKKRSKVLKLVIAVIAINTKLQKG